MGAMDIRIRRAGVEDAEALAEFGARLFEETFGAANDPDDMRDYLAGAFSPALQMAELADSNKAVWFATDEHDVLIGYTTMRRGSRGPGVSGGETAEVQRIYADGSWQRRGVGRRLMDQCIEQARAWGADVLWLAVWEQNPSAIAFYERSGFTKVGVTTFVLGRDVQHDLVMSLPLR
jgi:ribosomal protein S18 acetylase RimI-like enzyme